MGRQIGQPIPGPRDSEDHPTLLLRRNPVTGKWAWKRTKGPWIGGFDNFGAAVAEAERLGLMAPYETVVMPARGNQHDQIEDAGHDSGQRDSGQH